MSGFALSIVIPTFNTARMTLQTVHAARAAAPPRTEIIVVDDASTDGTHELLAREVPDVRVLRLHRNARYAAAVNAGVATSTGGIVLLLNSDAHVERNAIESLMDAFANDPQLGIAGARLIDPDGTAQWSGGRAPTLAWMIVLAGGFASLVPRRQRASGGAPAEWVSGAAMAVRRSVWHAVGPLSNRYRFYAQDLELCMRARDAGWSVRIIEDARVVHARGATVRQWRGSALDHDPALLWLDLLTFGRERYGTTWAIAARMLMSVAAAMRIAVRTLLFRDRAITRAYASALRQLFVEPEQTANERVG